MVPVLRRDEGRVFKINRAATLAFVSFASLLMLNSYSVNAQTNNAANSPVNIGQGTIDADRNQGPRFVRVKFDSLVTADHTVTVTWDSDADIRFLLNEQDGADLGPVINASNTGKWTGALEAGTPYFVGLWSRSGSANYTVTLEVDQANTTITNDVLTIPPAPVALALYSQEADENAWTLDGPAPTLDFKAGNDTDGWGRALLNIGDILLVGGDFKGIKAQKNSSNYTRRPWLAALDANTGQPVTTFNIPDQINSVVRSLALSPDGTQVYVGGDFGLVALNSTTGMFEFDVPIFDRGDAGRVFDILVNDTNMYIGGDFSQIGATNRNNLARLSLSGELDTAWDPNVAGGRTLGRSAPVQSLALSSFGDTLYVGGTFTLINSTPVATTERDTTVSVLAISTADGSVNAERFVPELVLGEFEDSKDLTVLDIAVYDNYVIIAWGGPNYLTLHQADGARLQQYSGPGDVQAIDIFGDLVIVGHHGEFLSTLTDPLPPEAVQSINPLQVEPYKLHTFRFDPVSARLIPEQNWQIRGTFGVWAIEATEDFLWIAGNLRRAGAKASDVEGLARFPRAGIPTQ